MHPLDRPVWASLSTHHASASEGNALARRFARDVSPFASTLDDAPAAVAALIDLVKSEESVFLLQVPQIVVPAGAETVCDRLGRRQLGPDEPDRIHKRKLRSLLPLFAEIPELNIVGTEQRSCILRLGPALALNALQSHAR